MQNKQELINKLKELKFHLVPMVNKKPISKNIGNGKAEWSWKRDQSGKYIEYSNQELLDNDIGINNEASHALDVDFDNVPDEFIHLIPETMEIISKKNGKEKVRKKIFLLDSSITEKDVEHKSWPDKNTSHHLEDGTIVEEITKTASWFLDKEGSTRYPRNIDKLKVIDPFQYSMIRKDIKKIYALTVLKKLYPPKDTNRDKFRLTLAGVLHQETDWSDTEKENFVTSLMNASGDKEVRKGLEKLRRVKRNIEKGRLGIWATRKLAQLVGRPGIDGGLDVIDAIRSDKRREELKQSKETTEEKEIDKSYSVPFQNYDQFVTTFFPEPNYLVEPLFQTEGITEIAGASGIGKTNFMLEVAGTISTASGMLGMCSVGKPKPILYVEGELPANSLQARVNTMFKKKAEFGHKVAPSFFNISYLQLMLKQSAEGFIPINTEQGMIGIENSMKEINKRTGQMPVVFLDNISCLAPGIKENDADAWSPLMNRMVKWKNMGTHVFYAHHLNKGGDPSGSTMQFRTIDMCLVMKKPEPSQKIKTYDTKGMQAICNFKKWREHDNSKHAEPFQLLLDEKWNWTKLPILTTNQSYLVKFYNEGLTVAQMENKFQELEIKISNKTIYSNLADLKKRKIIEEVTKREVN